MSVAYIENPGVAPSGIVRLLDIREQGPMTQTEDWNIRISSYHVASSWDISQP